MARNNTIFAAWSVCVKHVQALARVCTAIHLQPCCCTAQATEPPPLLAPGDAAADTQALALAVPAATDEHGVRVDGPQASALPGGSAAAAAAAAAAGPALWHHLAQRSFPGPQEPHTPPGAPRGVSHAPPGSPSGPPSGMLGASGACWSGSEHGAKSQRGEGPGGGDACVSTPACTQELRPALLPLPAPTAWCIPTPQEVAREGFAWAVHAGATDALSMQVCVRECVCVCVCPCVCVSLRNSVYCVLAHEHPHEGAEQNGFLRPKMVPLFCILPDSECAETLRYSING